LRDSEVLARCRRSSPRDNRRLGHHEPEKLLKSNWPLTLGCVLSFDGALDSARIKVQRCALAYRTSRWVTCHSITFLLQACSWISRKMFGKVKQIFPATSQFLSKLQPRSSRSFQHPRRPRKRTTLLTRSRILSTRKVSNRASPLCTSRQMAESPQMLRVSRDKVRSG
jgi:hypothetical protein